MVSERLHYKHRLPELDGLRGIALLLVICWHYGWCMIGYTHSYPFLEWMMFGWSGVDLFFVLSGFLLGGILLDVRESPNYFKTFYIRRACRILPIYYIMLIILVVATVDIAAGRLGRFHWLFENQDKIPLLSYLTFTQNIAMASTNTFGSFWLAVTWSLAVEEQFYLTLPLLVKFLPKKVFPIFLVIAIVSVPFGRAYLAPRIGPLACYFLPFCRADALLLGVLAAWACRNRILWKFLNDFRLLLYVPLLGFCGYIVYMKHYLGVTGILATEMMGFGFTCFALMFASLLLVCITHTGGVLAWIARREWLKRTGTVSYGIYLFHWPVLGIVQAIIFHDAPNGGYVSTAIVTILCFFLTCGLAALSWTFIEKPFLTLGRRDGYGDEGMQARTSVPVKPAINRDAPKLNETKIELRSTE